MLLRVERLTKRFGGLTANHQVDLSVERGQIHAIIGPNGVGKTTFFNLISGFYPPTSGRILFKGTNITGWPPERIAKKGIARTFQTTHLFEEATVLDNVIIGNRLRTRSGFWDVILRTKRERREERESLDRAREVLDFVGLSHLAGEPVSEITQEQKKRVAFALALATQPELVLLDEPAAGVNPDETDGLAVLIKKMADTGRTVCLIEHKTSMIMSLADRITVLNQGERIVEGTPEEIQGNPEVIEAYLGGDPTGDDRPQTV